MDTPLLPLFGSLHSVNRTLVCRSFEVTTLGPHTPFPAPPDGPPSPAPPSTTPFYLLLFPLVTPGTGGPGGRVGGTSRRSDPSRPSHGLSSRETFTHQPQQDKYSPEPGPGPDPKYPFIFESPSTMGKIVGKMTQKSIPLLRIHESV